MNSDEAIPRTLRNKWLIWPMALPLGGCSGVQSALDPAGREAQRLADLFWWMTAGSLLIWAAVIGLAVYAVRARADVDRRRQANLLILAGAVAPAVVLALLLIAGLPALPEMAGPSPEGTLRITVFGEQWWWRVRYEPPGRQPFELANEVRLAAGRPVEFLLRSNNVIHSFWIPSLGGKMDMIPGRVNRLRLHPTRTGSYRGACAEFCGIGHAHMAFDAIVVTPGEFEGWLEQQSQPASATAAAGGALE